jgi:hypothetical protein
VCRALFAWPEKAPHLADDTSTLRKPGEHGRLHGLLGGDFKHDTQHEDHHRDWHLGNSTKQHRLCDIAVSSLNNSTKTPGPLHCRRVPGV